MACSTVCAATIGAMTAATIVGGPYGLMLTTPALILSRHQPEIHKGIVGDWMIVTTVAATVGAGLGVLAAKVAKFAFQRITRDQ